MSDSPSNQRSKRQKIDKTGRFAALERLKQLKGSKHKYNLEDEVDNVYDEVDEREYSKRVLARADDDWIEDDGTGYVEDGREIFDDDEEEPIANSRAATSSSNPRAKKRLRDINADPNEKSSIKKLFSKAVPKKKEPAVKLAEDDILADILGEINPSSTRSSLPTATRRLSKDIEERNVVKDYMQSFAKKSEKSKSTSGNTSDDELLDKILKPKLQNKIKTIDMEPVKPAIIADTKVLKESVNKANIEINAVTYEDLPPSNSNASDDDAHMDEMDFSILDNDENQFEKKPDEGKIDTEEQTNATDTYDQLLSNWENICQAQNEDDNDLLNATMDDNTNFDKETEMKFWFWDAWEDPSKHKGQLYLFGKVPVEEKRPTDFKSVCVKIENVERCLYLLPRKYALDPITRKSTKQEVTMLDVYNEFNGTVAPELRLDTYRSKKVTKNFSFSVPGVNVPVVCDYMEIRYDGKKRAPDVHKKYNTIEHIFGVNTSSLERFLLECKIKGPGWLTLRNFQVNHSNFSWCKLEIICPTIAAISVSDEKNVSPPPLVLTTINIRTALNTKTAKNEIVMVSCLVNRKFAIDKPPPAAKAPFDQHFCGFTRPSSQSWPYNVQKIIDQYKGTKVTKLDSERALLSWFLAKFQGIDSDLIVIHDANDCQLDVICDRVAALRIPMWSRLGRLRMTKIFSKKFKDFFIGRMICDVKQSAEELIKSKSYDLQSLCTNVLKIKDDVRMDVSNDELCAMYESADGILKLITLTMQDCAFILRLMCELNVLPLALQITTVCGNLMGRTLQGGRSERNEYLLLHAFDEKNYIVPDKKIREYQNSYDLSSGGDKPVDATAGGTARKKAQYSGGLVLDPIKGFYDKYILLMDFNSLYPSIIQEYNICFTTIVEPAPGDEETPALPDSSMEQGVLPRQIRRLVESRREVKKLMANPDLDADQKMQYNIRQLALKLTANSMYGCLGFSHSRFYAQHLAALVTLKGREILVNTKSLVQKLSYEVIYGDTDSIMINSNCNDYDQVYKVGNQIKQAVNKIYRQVELDIDGVFKYLLLLKKKKYAAVTITRNKKTGEFVYTQEHKGLDIVRRDWSQISVLAGRLVLDELLSDIQMDKRIENIHGHLEKFGKNINDDEVPLPLLAITKQLTKQTKEYTNTTNLPHVQVAIRMNATRNKRFKKGDMVSYIICEDGTENSAMQRAYHIEEVKSMENLRIDKTYYLSQQIHPVVSRLLEPIEGTDASRIAVCLGLDASKFKTAAQRIQRERNENAVGESIIKSAVQKYRYCERFTFKCITCKAENLIATAFRRNEEQKLVPVLEFCANRECQMAPHRYLAAIRNELVLATRKCVRRFYENWMVCDDPHCNSNSRRLVHVEMNTRPVCLACKQGAMIRQYTESDLYTQLCYFQYMFDLSKHESANVKVSVDVEAAYLLLKETIDQIINQSAYSIIKMNKLFERIQPPPLCPPAATSNENGDVAMATVAN